MGFSSSAGGKFQSFQPHNFFEFIAICLTSTPIQEQYPRMLKNFYKTQESDLLLIPYQNCLPVIDEGHQKTTVKKEMQPIHDSSTSQRSIGPSDNKISEDEDEEDFRVARKPLKPRRKRSIKVKDDEDFIPAVAKPKTSDASPAVSKPHKIDEGNVMTSMKEDEPQSPRLTTQIHHDADVPIAETKASENTVTKIQHIQQHRLSVSRHKPVRSLQDIAKLNKDFRVKSQKAPSKPAAWAASAGKSGSSSMLVLT